MTIQIVRNTEGEIAIGNFCTFGKNNVAKSTRYCVNGDSVTDWFISSTDGNADQIIDSLSITVDGTIIEMIKNDPFAEGEVIVYEDTELDRIVLSFSISHESFVLCSDYNISLQYRPM